MLMRRSICKYCGICGPKRTSGLKAVDFALAAMSDPDQLVAPLWILHSSLPEPPSSETALTMRLHFDLSDGFCRICWETRGGTAYVGVRYKYTLTILRLLGTVRSGTPRNNTRRRHTSGARESFSSKTEISTSKEFHLIYHPTVTYPACI